MNAVTVLGWAISICYVYLGVVTVAFVLTLVASVLEHRERIRLFTTADLGMLAASRFTIPVSIIVPAFNEAILIESSVRSMLALNYPEFEVIVVSDGSDDDTVGVLGRAFQLQRRHAFFRRQLDCQTVHAVYASRSHGNLVVLDKAKGGKADALNAGVNAARFRYICGIDGDTILDRDSLLRAMQVAMQDPSRIVGLTSYVTISRHPERATAGNTTLEPQILSRCQTLDYIRAFLNNRLGWTRGNYMLCVSGAFALWRRDIVVEFGGFSSAFTCEDIEFTFRAHERLRRQGCEYQVMSLGRCVGRTEGPDTVRALITQRARWQRVITETVWHYRRMLLNPRYGSVGWIGMPFYLIVEVVAPIFETLSVGVTAVAWLWGVLDWHGVALILGAMALGNSALTNAALLMNERASHEYTLRDLVRLMLLGLVELVVYRPVLFVASAKGLMDCLRGRKSWDKGARNVRPSSARARAEAA